MMTDSRLERPLYDTGASSGPRIAWVAGKRLVAVDLPHYGSNQHELNGSRQLREAFGLDRVRGKIRWMRLSDDEGIASEEVGAFTWYDAREDHPIRSEHRLYYDSNTLLAVAEPGDLLILAWLESTDARELIGFVVPAGSSLETQLCWLFGLDPERLDQFTVPDPNVLADRSARIEATEIVESLGLLRKDDRPEVTDLTLVRRRFGDSFPTTAEMSAFAREEAPIDAAADPDHALLAWIEREEELFLALEEFLVVQKLDNGFTGVDDFISFSLSVQNRRKSRMGRALENHLGAVFDACDISYSHGAVTENNARPDFLFPGIDAYNDGTFPDDSLRMLGAKSTCKDRWRQVLSEAERIEQKHLCTLEPGISSRQTDEMIAHGLRLVLPKRVLESYTSDQAAWAINLADFIQLVA